MKFAWGTILVDFFGRQIPTNDGNVISLGQLALQCLAQYADTQDGLMKFRVFQVGLKLAADQDIDVTEAALIKEVTGKQLTALPVGRIWELLEHPLPENPSPEPNDNPILTPN